MNLEKQAAAEEIAVVAVGLDRAEREGYLRRRAVGDPEILAEVRRRLEAADEIPDGFLDRPDEELSDGSEDSAADRSRRDKAVEPTGAGPRELLFAEGRRYRLAEVLGKGGMAVVYRAFDRRLERPVAVKHLHCELAEDPRALKRFEREARAIAKVSHPAIVEIFDVLHDRDDLWIVMELVPGRPLSSRLAEGPLELREALFLAAGIADGLAAAHARDIVHRDLKPANVMVTPEGRVKILDFGLAAPTVSGDDSSTADDGLCGTPAAMSPEQIDHDRVESRSDLFSFGALLYRMVTGESPFGSFSPLITLERVCNFRPPPAARLNPQVPEELSSLIEALLEKDPDRRPQETSAVARTLARFAEPTTGAIPRWVQRSEPPFDVAAIPSAAAERRQVTVLSCQLVASGGASMLLEPEELLEVEGPFRDLAVPILERFRAHLGEWLDGGFRAYFGVLQAREDDPQRAVAAALELADAVARWSTGSLCRPGLRLRAGLNTGPAIVTTQPDGRREVVLGRTGSCATEVRTAASAGVLASAATHRLLRGFHCESLDVCPLELCRAPCEIFRVLAADSGGDEDEAVRELTPFVGREAELELLRQRWREAGESRGRVVLVSGDAGSGKSRLLRTFYGSLAAGPRTWIEISCQPTTSLFGLLSQALGCEDEDEPSVLMRRLAGRAAAVLAIEDVHLADPSDLELLGLLIDQAPAARLLLLLTCRTPFEAPWKVPLHMTVCSLGLLNTGQVERMIHHLTAAHPPRSPQGDAALPAAAEERILAAADGVPRFVEELTRTYLSPEEGVGTVPASLRSWLTGRLDRLGNAREVVRVASVLGREFTRQQLTALVPAAGDAVGRALDRLVEAGLLQRRGGRCPSYRFRLALDRDAAHESLLAEHRRLYEWRAAGFQ